MKYHSSISIPTSHMCKLKGFVCVIRAHIVTEFKFNQLIIFKINEFKKITSIVDNLNFFYNWKEIVNSQVQVLKYNFTNVFLPLIGRKI